MLRIPKVRKICVGNPHLNWQRISISTNVLHVKSNMSNEQRDCQPHLWAPIVSWANSRSRKPYASFCMQLAAIDLFPSTLGKRGNPNEKFIRCQSEWKKTHQAVCKGRRDTIYRCGLWQTIGSLRDDMKQWSLKNTYHLPTRPYPINT